MGLLDQVIDQALAIINPPPQVRKRDDRMFREGSPFYSHPLPSLALSTWTATLWTSDLWPDSRKYEPLDYIEVTNNDAVDLLLLMDTGDSVPVPAGTVRGRVDRPFRSFRIRNEDAAAATVLGKVYIVAQRRPTSIDRWARGERG